MHDDLVAAHVEALIATVAEQQTRIEALETALREVIMEFDNASEELVWDSIARARAALNKDAGK